MDLKKKIPVLKCYQTSPGQVKAWCPFCEKWHAHGYREGKRRGRIGHWVAHCSVPGSPLLHTGYYLTLMTRAELKAIGTSEQFFPKTGS
jgi:hypothetical protein